MNANTAKTIIGTLLPFASNPVVLTAIGVGAAAWAIASIFDKDNEEESNGSNTAQSRSEPSEQPLKRNRSTAQSTVHESLETAETTVATEDSEPLTPALSIVAEDETKSVTLFSEEETIASVTDQTTTSKPVLVDEEAATKEMIRKAMSELGKRSGAARRKAKIDRSTTFQNP
jgi:hypothetical protein